MLLRTTILVVPWYFRLGTFIVAATEQTFPDPEAGAKTVISIGQRVKNARLRIILTPDLANLRDRDENFDASPHETLEKKDGVKFL